MLAEDGRQGSRVVVLLGRRTLDLDKPHELCVVGERNGDTPVRAVREGAVRLPDEDAHVALVGDLALGVLDAVLHAVRGLEPVVEERSHAREPVLLVVGAVLHGRRGAPRLHLGAVRRDPHLRLEVRRLLPPSAIDG